MNAKARQHEMVPSDWIRLRAVVLGGLALVQEAVGTGVESTSNTSAVGSSHRTSGLAAYSKRQAKVVLSPAYLIVTEDDDLLRPSEICADLDEDIDADLRAIPAFMQGLYSILTDVGAKTTATGERARALSLFLSFSFSLSLSPLSRYALLSLPPRQRPRSHHSARRASGGMLVPKSAPCLGRGGCIYADVYRCIDCVTSHVRACISRFCVA